MFRTWIKPAAYAMTARLVIAGHNRERSITESEFGGNRGSIPRAQRPDRVHSPQRIYCQIVDYMVRLPYCALNGRTLLSTRINAVSAPLMLPELKDSATFPKGEMEEREEKKKRWRRRRSEQKNATVHEFRRCDTPPPLRVRPHCAYDFLSFRDFLQQGENLNSPFVLNFCAAFSSVLIYLFIFFPLSTAFYRESARNRRTKFAFEHRMRQIFNRSKVIKNC